MKKLLVGVILLASISSFASNGNSFQFPVGEYNGVTDRKNDCSLIITDDIGEYATAKYRLIFKENRKSYNAFPVKKIIYALEGIAQETGLYFNNIVEKRYGGTYTDYLSLLFGDNGKIERVVLKKAARIFGSETIINCNLDNEIDYSILNL